MIDYGGQKTDLAVRRAEWRLSRVYRQAAREIEEKMQAWQKGHEARDKKYRQMVKDGKLSKADYQAWMRGQVFQGNQWKARKEQIQQTLLNADRAASKIINEGKLGVFAENANYMGYSLEHDSGLNTGFSLYDEQTVARLIREEPKILPMLPPEKAVLKDKAYTYYNKLIGNAITQGIIQGETIQQIAHRIADKTGESSYSSAVRNARTAYTGAQNAGRIEGLHQAQALGIKVKKRWLAILDSKTRDSHAALDGQVQEVDDPFISPLGLIMYPGDPSADDPADVYNCRCTLTYEYPEYPSSMQRRDAETGEVLEDMTYEEWKKERLQKGFTFDQKNSIINTEQNNDVVTGSRQSKRKKDKVKTLGNVVPMPVETADAVKQLKRLGGEHTLREDCERTNPHYLDGEEWQQNCQRCCSTFEARRRGFDVTAKPLYGDPLNDKYAYGPMGFTKFFERGTRIPDNIYRTVGLDRDTVTIEQVKNGIQTIMDGYGNGSRAIISGYWESTGGGHVFIAENVGGRVQFYNVQSGDMNYIRPFDASFDPMQARSMSIFRIDDLPFSENIGDAVSNDDRT